MSRFETSIPPTYFDEMYARDPDPWRFAQSAYEREKYEATLRALPRRRYGAALEVGCSIGVLTRQLAPRCDRLLSLDVAGAALEQAGARCADQPHVVFERRRVPDDWPEGRFDLILLSEVVYYLDRNDVAELARKVAAAAAPAADIVLVHWLGETHYPLSGDEAAGLFIDSMRDVSVLERRREADYRLDVLRMS